MVVTGIGEGVDIEIGGTVEGGVEHHSCIGVPVAIDILWARETGTGRCVERHLVADGIARGGESCPGGDGALMCLHVVVVEDTEVLRERGLQTGVTPLDVQRVAVIDDVEQVAHLGLVDVGIVVHPQLAHL